MILKLCLYNKFREKRKEGKKKGRKGRCKEGGDHTLIVYNGRDGKEKGKKISVFPSNLFHFRKYCILTKFTK